MPRKDFQKRSEGKFFQTSGQREQRMQNYNKEGNILEKTKYILEARGIGKSFSGVTVLKDAELCIAPGELHALMGENGAGKSTLMKIIMGIYTKDAGTVLLDGKEMEFKSARDALDAGISMIHQELSPIPEMTVAENVFLGRELKKFKGLPFVNKKELNAKTQELLEDNEITD